MPRERQKLSINPNGRTNLLQWVRQGTCDAPTGHPAGCLSEPHVTSRQASRNKVHYSQSPRLKCSCTIENATPYISSLIPYPRGPHRINRVYHVPGPPSRPLILILRAVLASTPAQLLPCSRRSFIRSETRERPGEHGFNAAVELLIQAFISHRGDASVTVS